MNAIKYYREQKHLSQKQLAEALGVQATSISRYERGTRQLSVEKAKRIAVVLEIDWSLLYKDTDRCE